MRPRKHAFRKKLVSLIGIDYDLIMRSGGDNLEKFWLSGLILLLVVLISFCSVFYAFDLMFHKWYAEVLLALFFSLTFMNIYLLLLQTFSKQTLPAGYKTGFWTTSNLARAGYVLMISFLLAQPIRIFCFRTALDADILVYRQHLVQQFDQHNRQLYQADILQLRSRAGELSRLPDGPTRSAALAANQVSLTEIEAQLSAEHESAAQQIAAADFFLQRIKLVGRYPGSWVLCLALILFYGLPVLLIYSISGHSGYYLQKKERDRDMVLRHYAQFKERYAQLFAEHYQLEVHYSEPFADAPFNWERKPLPVYGNADDFRNDLC